MEVELGRFHQVFLTFLLFLFGMQPASAQYSSSFDDAADWLTQRCPDLELPGQFTFTAGQTPTSGSPAPGYEIEHAYDLRIYLCHVYQPESVEILAREIDSVRFGLDADLVGGTGAGIGFAPLIIQDGTAFVGLPLTRVTSSGATINSVALEASSFVSVVSRAEAALQNSTNQTDQHPNFGCEAPPLTIGFLSSNQTGGGSTPESRAHRREALVDNWSFEVTRGDACGLDIGMNKTARQASVGAGEHVDFDFEFSVIDGNFGNGDSLVVTDTLPRGFRPENLPRLANGDDWRCTVTARPTQTAGREVTCISRPGLEEIPPLSIGTTAPSNRFGQFENCADLAVTREGNEVDRVLENNLNQCATVTVVEPARPDFSVTKTIESCESFAANAYRCTYNIRIENNGGPYTGELQIEDVTNQSVNRFFLFDANRNPISCQAFTGTQQPRLTFSDGTVTSSRFDVCTIPNISIDAATPIELTALVQLERSTSSEAPLNCAAVVMWDGRPDGMQTDDFPSSCIDAFPPADETGPELPPTCALSIRASAPDTDIGIGERFEASFNFANIGTLECEVLRFQAYTGIFDPASTQTAWFANGNLLHALSQQPSEWYVGQTYPAAIGQSASSHPDLIWLHPSRRTGYNGSPVSNVAFQPGTTLTYSGISDQMTAQTLPAYGALVCGFAVVSLSEYAGLGQTLSAQIDANRPAGQTQTNGYDEWAANINDDLVAAGVENIHCLGWNIR